MTVEFPKGASNDSVIQGYSITYTTEGLEDFVSKGRAVSTRPQKILMNLEEGAKYNITIEPLTHFLYHLEAGHTVQQTRQAGMLVVDGVCHCIPHYIRTHIIFFCI